MKLYGGKTDFLSLNEMDMCLHIRSYRAFRQEELLDAKVTKKKGKGGRKSPSSIKLTPEEKQLLKNLGINQKTLRVILKERTKNE
jgi:hypothetical protein